MLIVTIIVIIEEATDNAVTELLVNKYCTISPEKIEEGFTLMDICGTDYEAYLRIALLATFLISSGVFLMNPYNGHMTKFNRT